MRRLVALLLRGLPVSIVFAGDPESIVSAIEGGALAAAVVVAERFGWPGAGAAAVLRESGTPTVFVSHDLPGRGWEFVHAAVQLPFSTGDLADQVRSALDGGSDGPLDRR